MTRKAILIKQSLMENKRRLSKLKFENFSTPPRKLLASNSPMFNVGRSQLSWDFGTSRSSKRDDYSFTKFYGRCSMYCLKNEQESIIRFNKLRQTREFLRLIIYTAIFLNGCRISDTVSMRSTRYCTNI